MVAPVMDGFTPGADAGRRVRGDAENYLRTLVRAGGQEVDALDCSKGRVAVYAAIYSSHPYSLSVPSLTMPRLAVNLTASPVTGGLDGDRLRNFDSRRHSLFLTPAGAAAHWRKELPSRHLAIYFSPEVFDCADHGTPSRSAFKCLLNESVPGIGPLADQLTCELQSKDNLSIEAADSLARLILIRVARRFHSESSTACALTPKAVERLRDYVTARLSDRILVADLAKQVGLSPNHFARVFTEQIGYPPYRFVRAIRIKRAATLLSQSPLTLAHIALDCGFSSQQHLSNVFRQHMGATPSQYRASARQATPG